MTRDEPLMERLYELFPRLYDRWRARRDDELLTETIEVMHALCHRLSIAPPWSSAEPSTEATIVSEQPCGE